MVSGQVEPGEQELDCLPTCDPDSLHLVDHQSEGATNSSQKAFGFPGESALNLMRFICHLGLCHHWRAAGGMLPWQ